MTKIICARSIKTVRNIKPKPWKQISGPSSGFLVLDLNSWSPGLGSCVWILSLRSWVLGPGSWVLFPASWVPVLSMVIIKCDKKY